MKISEVNIELEYFKIKSNEAMDVYKGNNVSIEIIRFTYNIEVLGNSFLGFYEIRK